MIELNNTKSDMAFNLEKPKNDFFTMKPKKRLFIYPDDDRKVEYFMN
jgi:hypothetical protein